MEDWEKEFDMWYEKTYRHALNPDATEHCKVSCNTRHEFHHCINQDIMRIDIKDFFRSVFEKLSTPPIPARSTTDFPKQDLKKKIEEWIEKSKDRKITHGGITCHIHDVVLSDLQEFLKTI